MSKRLILVLALALVAGLAVSAYAEVQNVKVSGDLLLRAITRSDFTLESDYKYKASGFTSTARLRVDADLTDNVSTTVRLLNERQWGGKSYYSAYEYYDAPPIIPIMYSGFYGNSDAINIDLAYVTMKEFLYSPLTMTLGRQELRFGNALVIGDVNTNYLADNYNVPLDLSAKKAFDAMRATLNYDEVVLDIIYAKIDEVSTFWMPFGMFGPEKNDTDLYGVNATFDLSGLNLTGKADLYWFSRVNKGPIHYEGGKKDTLNTIGGMITGKIADNMTGSLEYAMQFGKGQCYEDPGFSTEKYRGWALQGVVGYDFEANYAPNLTVMYTYLSGDKDDTDDKNKGWDPMFEDQTPNNIVNALFPNTNCMALNVLGSIKPNEDLKLSANLGFYRLAQRVAAGGFYGVYNGYSLTGKKTMGTALDLTATYDYTEDVQLGLTFGMFDPGKAFDKSLGYKEDATQLIGSMKVTF